MSAKALQRDAKAFEWVTEDFRLRHRVDVEIMRADLARTSSAAAYSWIVKTMITKEQGGSPKMTLDVGCGWGRETAQFRNAVGVDLCLPYIKTAKNYTSHDYVLADAHYLPFKSDLFDFVCLSEVIEHLVDVEDAVSEIARTLANDGQLMIQTPNRWVTFGSVIHKGFGHMREFSRKELTDLLTHLNLRVRLVTGSTIPYIPTKNRFYWLNSNRAFFTLWKIVNRFLPIRWDIIACAEKCIPR